MQFGPFCCTRLCSVLSALLLPSLQAACSAADYLNIFCVSAFCLSPSSVHSTGVFFFNSVSQLWDPGSPPWHAVNPHSPSIISVMSPSLSPAPHSSDSSGGPSTTRLCQSTRGWKFAGLSAITSIWIFSPRTHEKSTGSQTGRRCSNITTEAFTWFGPWCTCCHACFDVDLNQELWA